MITRDALSLSELTTFHVGGIVRLVIECFTQEEVQTAVAYIRDRGLSFVVLGGGSNVLPPDEGYEGAILLMKIPGVVINEDEQAVRVTAGAGVSWDELVTEVTEKGYWGMENLAGIPGTVGAAPVQNIGAYGAEIQTMFAYLDAFDVNQGAFVRIALEEAQFGYRDSRFKHEPNLIITSVSFNLVKESGPHIEYADLQAVEKQGVDLSTPHAVAAAVREIRKAKFPDLAHFGTAGSFFKNPIVSSELFTELTNRYGAIPCFPVAGGLKIPLAFILDRVLNLRGHRKGNAWLFGNQPLVLVADRGARAEEVESLAHEIEEKVFSATGISIEREVRMLSARETK